MCGDMDRRSFVTTLPVLAAAVGVGACGGAAYLTPTLRAGVLRVPVSDVGAGAVVVWPGREHPLFVSPSADGTWRSVSTRCTHRGCQVEPEGERLVCPCHGSEFARDGRRLEGPAQNDLPRLPVREANGELLIDVSGGAA